MSLNNPSRAQTPDTFSFAVVGDTQRTLGVEQVFLGREQNDKERTLIMNDISKQPIDFLVHVGDLVGKGTEKNWKYFDNLVAPVTTKNIPIFPILGNHDVFGKTQYFYDRFPSLNGRRYYTEKVQSLQLIWLDSNVLSFSKQDWANQITWFTQTLKDADTNPEIRAVLVFLHHPPFTNSRVTGDGKFVQASFLPVYTSSRKALLWVNGHVHSYEHFFENGKHFLTSGGGGGPRVKLYFGDKERHHDLFHYDGVPGAQRPFNYLLIQSSPTQISVTVRALKKGETEIYPLDSLTLDYPPAP